MLSASKQGKKRSHDQVALLEENERNVCFVTLNEAIQDHHRKLNIKCSNVTCRISINKSLSPPSSSITLLLLGIQNSCPNFFSIILFHQLSYYCLLTKIQRPREVRPTQYVTILVINIYEDSQSKHYFCFNIFEMPQIRRIFR